MLIADTYLPIRNHGRSKLLAQKDMRVIADLRPMRWRWPDPRCFSAAVPLFNAAVRGPAYGDQDTAAVCAVIEANGPACPVPQKNKPRPFGAGA